jgi:glyoxylase-like metal-dependent hydrolase (beta-lactamase superfamily II)
MKTLNDLRPAPKSIFRSGILKAGKIVWIVFSFISCYPILFAQDSTSRLVDSLITVQKINEKTILIGLGADAVTAIAAQKGIVVIDAGISGTLTAKYRKIIEREFGRTDFAYLINTHGHHDHTGGNRVFTDVRIAGHENCLNEISGQWKDPEKVKAALLKVVNEYDKELQTLEPGTDEWNDVYSQKARYQYAYCDALNNYPLVKPDVLFNDTLDINMGDITIQLIYFGKAHSASDILIHIPELKLLMVGDLFSHYGRPSINDDERSEVDRWLKVMEWVEERQENIDVIIGGHGQLMTIKDLNSFKNFVQKSAGN